VRVVAAVIFDMDGVLVDTEHLWDEVRAQLIHDWGGVDVPGAQVAMMGMSSPEWSHYLHDVVGLRPAPAEINTEVVRRMLERYATDLPVIPDAVEAAETLHRRGIPLAVASSSNRPLIDGVLAELGVTDLFAVTVSSEEVGRGKPAPDVYLEAAHLLGADPPACVAVEDSSNGIRAAHAAGMRVLAYPNRHYPPVADALALADHILDGLADLPRVVDSLS
jgi:HAD superfamily hydrolase (TIGR01509 family)